jgi:hypothetical protein
LEDTAQRKVRVRLRSPTLTTHGVRGKEKSEPRVLRVSTYISNTPPRFHGKAKWKRKKKGMDGETRKNLGKRCKRRTMHLTINKSASKGTRSNRTPHLSPSSRLIWSARLMTPASMMWSVLVSRSLPRRKRKSTRMEWIDVPSHGSMSSSFIECK